ncbi:MAG: hypothetical protein PF569_03035 [Candidatus Woesearchaeota archaeon]|jgi:phosphomannomutase|nr:hypothetical protein [Candidatus Woesearchaeota archaeon]
MSIFRAYDIRGIYPSELSEKDAYLIGYYLVKYLNLKEIKIAHDLRLSFEAITKFFIQGVLDAGSKPIYLGELSTPGFYYSLFEGVNSGVMITASHNSKEYNGIKVMNNMESFDSRNGMFDLEKLVIEDKDNKIVELNQIESDLNDLFLADFLKENEVEYYLTKENYVNFLKDYYDKILDEEEKKVLENIKFSLDFSSGVSSLGVVPFLEKTKLNYNLLNEKPDGNFPVHSPDPLKAKEYLSKLNLKDNLFTCAFDGDGDRIVFYDENSRFILQDYIIAMFIDYYVSEGSKSFVCDLRESRVAFDIAKENDVTLKPLRVGRSFYQDFLKEHSCIFGAELSGHMFFRDYRNLDNPDIALIIMLKIVSKELLKGNYNFKFSDLVVKYKTYERIQETNLKVKDADKVLEFLKNKYEKNLVMEIDGYSFDLGDYWFNVRKSNTEPIIRINLEGKDKTKTQEEFDNLIKFINSV